MPLSREIDRSQQSRGDMSQGLARANERIDAARETERSAQRAEAKFHTSGYDPFDEGAEDKYLGSFKATRSQDIAINDAEEALEKKKEFIMAKYKKENGEGAKRPRQMNAEEESPLTGTKIPHSPRIRRPIRGPEIEFSYQMPQQLTPFDPTGVSVARSRIAQPANVQSETSEIGEEPDWAEFCIPMFLVYAAALGPRSMPREAVSTSAYPTSALGPCVDIAAAAAIVAERRRLHKKQLDMFM